jgi:predicted AlkP superfamily phosphohydrolase/phosphomutase
MFVIIGLDRIHHAFWRYFDSDHHLYEPDNEFEKVVEDYYLYLDRKIGELLEIIDDQTVVMVTSDHGGKAMKGCFCINTWLEEKELLKIQENYKGIKRLSDVEVDWQNTTAWGWGGYYARVFLNVKGREDNGVIEPENYEESRNKIIELIKEIKGPNGETWDTKVLKPEEIFPETKGNPPDLMIYFDNFSWRSAGTIGHENKYLLENDTGPDDAVHDKNGLYIYYDPKKNFHGEKEDKNILDIAPTLMKTLDLEIPKECQGIPIVL